MILFIGLSFPTSHLSMRKPPVVHSFKHFLFLPLLCLDCPGAGIFERETRYWLEINGPKWRSLEGHIHQKPDLRTCSICSDASFCCNRWPWFTEIVAVSSSLSGSQVSNITFSMSQLLIAGDRHARLDRAGQFLFLGVRLLSFASGTFISSIWTSSRASTTNENLVRKSG